TLLEDLRWRGLVADCTDEAELAARLASDTKITLYCGFDPTAESLHVGNLVPLLALRRFQIYGHQPIALAGGATGMIGDPSGKSAERNLQTPQQILHNVQCIKKQLHRLLDFQSAKNPARLVDNATWTTPLTYLEFLRDVGKHFTVNWMVAKESVRARMEDRENGISYTEFSYMLLQAYDFYHLHHAQGCELQIGATDQWGNITAGIELIRRKSNAHAFGLTAPLMTKADGTKYGKTAAGAVWLDPQKTSPYRFYQFFVQLEDADVIKIMKMLSVADHGTIDDLARQHTENPGARAAHLALARELTTLVHGESACADAMRASEIMFGGGLDGVGEAVFKDVVGEVPTKDFDKAKLDGAGTPLTELLVHAGLAASKGQARKDIEGGGIYLNNARVAEVGRVATVRDLLFGQYILLRKGKRTYAVVKTG
ncbi:MAG: tyrosine--tRNA ligase, partial [Opitutaceae bacterium]